MYKSIYTMYIFGFRKFIIAMLTIMFYFFSWIKVTIFIFKSKVMNIFFNKYVQWSWKNNRNKMKILLHNNVALQVFFYILLLGCLTDVYPEFSITHIDIITICLDVIVYFHFMFCRSCKATSMYVTYLKLTIN